MAKKKITLKTANGQDSLYPRTAASQVEVTANTTLDSYMKGMVDSISDGTTVVVKEAKKVSNSLKIKNAAGTSVTFDGSAELDLSAGVDYATTATNLSSAPSINNGDTNNTIKINAGGKDSNSFTVPYATKALKDDDNNEIKTTYAKVADLEFGNIVVFTANNLEYNDETITASSLIEKAKEEINTELGDVVTQTEFNNLKSSVTTNSNDISTLKSTTTSHTTSIGKLENADKNFETRITTLETNTSRVYTPKGSVSNIAALKLLTEVKEGYVYNIITGGEWNDGLTIPDGANVVYINETPNMAELYDSWDILGGIVDLSDYVTSSQLAGKQDIITDLATIRSGAAAGATALQSYTEKYTGTITEVKANGTSVATSGVANIPAASTSVYGVTKLSSATDISVENLAATPKAVKTAYDLANGKYTKPSTGIPKSDLTSEVQTSLGKADTALQTHQDISGKLDITTAANTYAKQADVESYIGAKGSDNKPMGLTYTVDGTVTY